MNSNILIAYANISPLKRTTFGENVSSIRLNYKFYYYTQVMEFHASCIRKTNNLRSSNLDKVDSRGAGDRNTISDRGEYRYVLTPRSLSSPFSRTIDGKRKKCGRRGRKDASRGHGRERVQQPAGSVVSVNAGGFV